jgi:TolA-binding protein
MEDFETAMKLYLDLQRSTGQIDHEAEDLASNYFAARAQNTWTSEAENGDSRVSQDGWEGQFNNAYGLIALGKLDEAESALQNAESMLCQRRGLLIFRNV